MIPASSGTGGASVFYSSDASGGRGNALIAAEGTAGASSSPQRRCRPGGVGEREAPPVRVEAELRHHRERRAPRQLQQLQHLARAAGDDGRHRSGRTLRRQRPGISYCSARAPDRSDRPSAPTEKYLYHSFVESPDMKNVYDGVAARSARRSLDRVAGLVRGAERAFPLHRLTALSAPAPANL